MSVHATAPTTALDELVAPTRATLPARPTPPRSALVRSASPERMDAGGLPAVQRPPVLAARTSSASLTSSRQRTMVLLPPLLLKPGTEMLKVSVKSARRVKSRRVWLELAEDEMGALGLEMGAGSGQDIRICWEKGGKGLKREASIPLSSLRDLRFGTSGSPYRTSLHLSPIVEPRWMTLIYLLPPPLSLLTGTTTPIYKLVHFIAPSAEVLEVWRGVLESYRENKSTGGMSYSFSGLAIKDGEVEGVEERVVKEEEVHRLCARLGMGMGRDEVGLVFRNSAAPKDYLDFTAFQRFVKLLKRREDLETIYQGLVGTGAGLDLATWSTFLRDVQKCLLSPELLEAVFHRYSDPVTHLVTLEGFNSYLVSSDNPVLKDDAHQDMTRPLSEYYISSSHNTYLVGNQLQGESTVEGYIRALQQGCRCVELDVWSGDDATPVITHGRTLTTKIPALDALTAISQYAFLASPYPLILSLEIHCDEQQQDILYGLLKEIFGERLLQERIEGDGGGVEAERLPSPWDLRFKVLLKAKNLRAQSAASSIEFDATSSTDSSLSSSESDFKTRVLNAVRSRFDDRRSPSPSRTIVPTPSPPLPTAPSLASLLIYTTSTKPRGFNKKESYPPTHVLSFGELSLIKLLRDVEGVRNDLVAHNRTHLTRVYPKGARIGSTNFRPEWAWAAGVQMVAVNWQTYDIGMQLNTAMFARAGRSGYVLKPALLRKKGGEKDKEALIRVASFVLDIEIISGQQLPRTASERMDPFVELSLFVPGLAIAIKRRTKPIVNNAFSPLFRTAFEIPFSSHPGEGMLDLVFLRLEVLDARGTGGEASVGSWTTGLGRLLGGYRHLPLYDAMGDQHLFSTLFIRSDVRVVG